MATIVLSAAGMALGGMVGGTVAGLSTAVIGRAVGATFGRMIDQRIMGSGSEPVETGRVDRFRLTGASEGSPLPQIYGRMRVAGQVIWATEFLERSKTSGGGKGGPSQPETKTYSYSVSMAIALCEGEITRVGRVWADGVEISRDDLNMRVYTGAADQMPDPKIEAVEGAGNAPAYRGVAYVVLEDLGLGQFGNRVPQLSFEVSRPSAKDVAETDIAQKIQAVAMMPGTGEYALATSPVYRKANYGQTTPININSPSGKSDFETSLEVLQDELPECGSVSLVVSWFGDDLRAGHCRLRPKVERDFDDPNEMPWRVSGLTRNTAVVIDEIDGRPVYGGTPSDQSVVEAIQEMKRVGQEVVFYPFILMEQGPENGLTDPYTGAQHQPELPWRGRITTDVAPNVEGSTDGTAAAESEVSMFFGSASAGDFSTSGSTVSYSGGNDWSYRRFILHYAHLCAAAGGVDAFCIGSEMRGLTQIRGASGQFVSVAQLQSLAQEVRGILGASCKIGYAADWSEYFGYQPQDGSGDRLFHLDPLWADPAIDFIGIDNYMPLSDWRDGDDHLDASYGAIYDHAYLSGNVAGGEGYDWYYHSPEAREAQIRTPIEDAQHNEPWIWRYKDLPGWWGNLHHERVAGVRSDTPTAWVPESKPIWFTELGCAAVDKGTNQPNKFLDPKSSESGLPHYSNGLRDEFIQMQYLSVMMDHYKDVTNNPVSTEYGAPMVDTARCHVWAWDARPYPAFPNNRDLWSDGANYARGHWISGRASARSLASVVAEICERSGMYDFDVSRLWGVVRGYEVVDTDTARAALQPLMLTYGFDAFERDGVMIFASRTGQATHDIDAELLALADDTDGVVEATRAPEAEVAGRVRLGFVEADGDFEVRSSEAVFPGDESFGVTATSVPLALTQGEAQQVTERWLSEARIARDAVKFALPQSQIDVGAGDVVRLPDQGLYRVDRVEQVGLQQIEAVRVETETYRAHEAEDEVARVSSFVPPVPVAATFLDLPLLSGGEVEHAPHIAATASPWPGSVALYSAAQDSGYALNTLISGPATVGVTESVLLPHAPGLWDRTDAVRVRLVRGSLDTASLEEVLAGANLMAIGDGSSDNWELFQFAEAQLVAPLTYDLRMRLRGQLGSDAIVGSDWPVGSRVVLLDGVPEQIGLGASARDVARHFRYGPALRPNDDPSYQYEVQAFQGIGLRPYAPCHIKVVQDGADTAVSWIRRTRIDGDAWVGLDVPLGEASEQYLVRVIVGGAIVRETVVTSTNWTYFAGLRSADTGGANFQLAVAQVSEKFGPGPFKSVDVAA